MYEIYPTCTPILVDSNLRPEGYSGEPISRHRLLPRAIAAQESCYRDIGRTVIWDTVAERKCE